LTTEYPANGSFFRPHTRSVHWDYRVQAWRSDSQESGAEAGRR